MHAPGKADLNLYAYVHGRVLVAVDPVGLEKTDTECDTEEVAEPASDGGTVFREQLICKANTEGNNVTSAWAGEAKPDQNRGQRQAQRLARHDLPPDEAAAYLAPISPAAAGAYGVGYQVKHGIVAPIARWLASVVGGPTYTWHLGSEGPIQVKQTDYSDAAPAIGQVAMIAIGGIETSTAGAAPSGFATPEAFGQFGARLRAGLAEAGYADAEPLLQGSAVTGRSFRSGAAFDAGRVSDFDVALGSPSLLSRARELGVGLRSAGTRTGPLSPDQVQQLGLAPLQQCLSEMAGRPVNFMIYGDAGAAAARSPSIPIPGGQ